MDKSVSIIDYGCGNLFSVERAVRHCGGEPRLVSSASEISDSNRLILPGVGAFANAMNKLRDRNLVDAICDASRKKPLLGICVGMQLLFQESDEFGTSKGLGLIPGRVERIPSQTVMGRRQKVPHIGWSRLMRSSETSSWSPWPLRVTAEHTPMYFVHSFSAVPTESATRIADCEYNGQRYLAAVGSGHVFGTQFHPEKSGPLGLEIIAEFLDWVPQVVS